MKLQVERREWPSLIDQHRYALGGGILVLLFLLYAWLVYTSGMRQLSALEQASMAVLGVLVSGVLGVLLGIPLAKRRVKIASQLRRAYGISLTLRSIQRDLSEASARMRDRHGLTTNSEILTEFWTEVANNLRTALRGPILETERMVEDWGEFDPEERARIEGSEQERNDQIQKLSMEIATAKSVERDLEGVDKAGALSATVARLEQYLREIQESQSTRISAPAPVNAKALREQGQYQEAVKAYDEIISRYPRVHTNFIGRAKARYLAGDLKGALDDLKKAEEICATDPSIGALRAEISAGRSATTALPTNGKEEVLLGNEALSSGDGPEAGRHYTQAEELGWNFYFARFNWAMAQCLQGDFTAALGVLAEFNESSDSYMAVNKEGLKAICNALSDVPASTERLRQLAEQSKFNYSKSPLRFLEAGLRAKSPAFVAKSREVFDVLKSSSGLAGA